MNTIRFGIIGGSGLYKMDGLDDVREIAVDTPYGAPSAPLRSHANTEFMRSLTSIQRKPLFWSQRIISTSSAVMMQPQTSGMPKSNCSPIAEPTTSARSQAAMASSHRTQRNNKTGFE